MALFVVIVYSIIKYGARQETRAGKVFAEGLLIFAKVNVIFLYTSG
jgi:hypothetical protein